MLNHNQNSEGPDPKMIARVKNETVLEIRKDNLLNFGINILLIVFFVTAVCGFIIFDLSD